MESRQCAACGHAFWPCSQVRQQYYCQAPPCQRERRRRWQQVKRKDDADYRDNQVRAQRSWRERHPDYWREYRRTHPLYCKRNRAQQANRNARLRERLIANMDDPKRPAALRSGVYLITPLSLPDGVKMDVLIVEITVLSALQ